MTGECKKLGKPIGIVRKREAKADNEGDTDMSGVGQGNEYQDGGKTEELEIVEIVKYKIVFSARPEPISGMAEAR